MPVWSLRFPVDDVLHALRRHPFPVVAHFDHCLVLTYAVRPAAVQPLLPPGLELDLYEGHAFLAVALVQTRNLRPAGFPSWMGRDFFLSGYRIFTRFPLPDGRRLRGLRILRSDTDKRSMKWVGNALTHYRYHHCKADLRAHGETMSVRIESDDGQSDLEVDAALNEATSPPPGSPFPDLATARKYAGPLPFTFDYEPATHSIIAIEGQRQGWTPRPVKVDVRRLSFLEKPMLRAADPVLANAFYVRDLPYRWKRGVRHPVPRGAS